jgi:hypothetical protein
MITNPKERISSDRLRRFISENKTKISNPISDCAINAEIFVGDWCLFVNKKIITIGQIIGFQYKKGRGKKKKFTYDVCPIKPPADCLEPKGIEVVGNWFLYSPENKFLKLIGNTFFMDIECYAAHILPPDFEDGKLILSDESLNYIKTLTCSTDDPLLF